MEFSLKPSGTTQKLPLQLNTKHSLAQKENLASKFYVRSYKVDTKTLNIQISYRLNCPNPLISIKNETILLSSVQPFEITTKYLSLLMTDEIDRFYIGEEFCVMPTLHSLSPWPIVIESTSFEFVMNFFSPLESLSH